MIKIEMLNEDEIKYNKYPLFARVLRYEMLNV
jgi:hypothetical protein